MTMQLFDSLEQLRKPPAGPTCSHSQPVKSSSSVGGDSASTYDALLNPVVLVFNMQSFDFYDRYDFWKVIDIVKQSHFG